MDNATRGIRGAITVGEGPEAIASATSELLARIAETNDCRPEDVAALIFTLTDDLADANPAAAARASGWPDVPLLMVREHGGDTRVARCLRVLVLWNTSKPQAEVRHAYLREAAALRPDRAD